MRPKRVLLTRINGCWRTPPVVKHQKVEEDLVEERAGTFDGRRGRKLSGYEESLMQSVQAAFDSGALDRLSPRERECFTDTIITGDSFESVAKRYHISRSAVQKYVKDAAAKIREEANDR